jgi:hypothetical protein
MVQGTGPPPFALPAKRLYDMGGRVPVSTLPGDQFDVSFHELLPGGPIEVPVSAGEIVGQIDPDAVTRRPADLGVMSLAIYGNPRAYPDDGYALSTDLSLDLQPDAAIKGPGGFLAFSVPLTATVQASDGADDLDWRYSYHSSQPFNELDIGAIRGGFTKAFVDTIVLLPLLLFLAVVVVLPRLGGDDAAAFFVGVAAFLAALLPIRLILVPAELSSLTSVDLALGAEMALIVGASMILAEGHWCARRQTVCICRRPLLAAHEPSVSVQAVRRIL